MDTRRLQRTLFRMQLDPAFAAAIFAGDVAAERSTGLDRAGLAMLQCLDPVAVAADPGGRRRGQVLGNLSTEFVLTVSVALSAERRADFLNEFTGSEDFHNAITEDSPLPLAFAAFAERAANASNSRHFQAIARLEAAMARARRAPRAVTLPTSGAFTLSPHAWLVALPDGALAWAEDARLHIDRSEALPAARVVDGADGGETALVKATPAPTPRRLSQIVVERLEDAVARLLRAAEHGLDEATRDRVAECTGATRDELDDFIASLVDDGVLVRGE